MSQAPQRSQQWHEARKSKITGSVSGAILGLNPYMTPEAVMRRLVRDFSRARERILQATLLPSTAKITNP